MNALMSQTVLLGNEVELVSDNEVSVGAALSKARRSCELSIEQVAQITRVPIRYLAAIEAERFDEIPAVIYIKGFVKAFARAVGVSERWAIDAVNLALRKANNSATT